MVVRNEADRYLGSVLRWHSFVDDVHVYDDQSTDDTAHQAAFRGAETEVRPETIPSFMEHEGQFRQAAWSSFEEHCNPQLGDWVLLLDADEFLVSGEREIIEAELDKADTQGAKSIVLRIHEVFEMRGVMPLVRKDGYWPTIQASRLIRYEPGGVFPDRVMASGSHPTFVNGGAAMLSIDMSILHYGYARHADRVVKYNRYLNRPGHNASHIESILTKPKLEPWSGRIPIL